MTRILIAFFASLFISFSSMGEEIKIKDLTIMLPDSIKSLPTNSKDIILNATDGKNLSIYLAYIPLSGKDRTKIDERGDYVVFPKLRDAAIVSTEKENWTDWTHDYVKRTYELPLEGDSVQTLYTYHINDNDFCYVFLFVPETEEGKMIAQDLMESGISNGSWFGNAALGWMFTFMVLFLALLFIFDWDDNYSIGRHVKIGLIALAIFAFLAAYVMRFDYSHYTSALLVAFIIVVATPPLRKPIVFIFEHIES